MTKDNDKAGPYEASVQFVTERAKPYLRNITRKFIDKSIRKYASDNPRFAQMIQFEVVRRGEGAGLTQDVAEPLIWIGVKSALALGIQVAAESFKNKKIKWVGRISAAVTLANQGVELLRILPRYKAGLQGSLEMAKERWYSIEKTGLDPFSSQTTQLPVSPAGAPPLHLKKFTQTIPSRLISPATVLADTRDGRKQAL